MSLYIQSRRRGQQFATVPYPGLKAIYSIDADSPSTFLLTNYLDNISKCRGCFQRELSITMQIYMLLPLSEIRTETLHGEILYPLHMPLHLSATTLAARLDNE